MDAAPLTSDRMRELAELRSRAYGPDADIERDEDALARLIELEELARTDAPVPADADSDAPASVVAPAPPTAVVVDDGALTDAAPAPRRAWWRRIPVAAIVALAAMAGLGVGLALPALTQPQPAAVLRPAPFVDGVELDFRMYGIPAESPVRYEPFRTFEVWSGQTREGSICVVVTSAVGEWLTSGCAPEPLSPTADIVFSPGMREVEGFDLAEGSVVRFQLRGDVMEVWIAETDETA
jgi:hypothetical protein